MAVDKWTKRSHRNTIFVTGVLTEKEISHGQMRLKEMLYLLEVEEFKRSRKESCLTNGWVTALS